MINTVTENTLVKGVVGVINFLGNCRPCWEEVWEVLGTSFLVKLISEGTG